ncbi:MAG: hypothetical protein CJD30_11405 [Sulfuricurvum sp. PD_MW2]|jgi:hypothetical protein|uniref:DNA-binding protein n=1 Tax=Sulfuricurvum sp. PD_MW2 TaxID=2027917 RepID=UPI000C067163|nr:DNA-binding protein [Sulfuricurvum sp. PD_MW2]PHM16465.1 MAG: hypothetical protein CJD30_11405 [Sulfuricurvum sp. PD_MW2]
MNQSDEIKMVSHMLFQQYGALVLDTKQVASILGIAEITLKQNRGNGIGLPYVKVGKSVKYKIIDIANFLFKNTMKVF